jgi:3-methyladenine DNA glycosylase/8-oxoguanine DNA glycosylase
VHAIVRRLRRIFDLDADSATIDGQLREDPWLKPDVDAAPGLRVPGAWDGFETSVRAILGQQVSVARARDIAQVLVDRIGGGLFPTPAQLASANINDLGLMPAARCQAVTALARGVAEGSVQLDECADAEQLQRLLTAIKGIGPWTAGYIAMRIARDPDTFLDSDWVVRKALEDAPSRAQSDRWRPWRAYAVMVLWNRIGRQREALRLERRRVGQDAAGSTRKHKEVPGRIAAL